MHFRWSLSRRVFFVFSLLAAATTYRAEATAASFTLSWVDDSADEDGFEIERKTGTDGTYAQVATVGANVTSNTDLEQIAFACTTASEQITGYESLLQ